MAVDRKIASCVFDCLERMLKNGEFCDFTIIVEDERIQCHRNILGACSEFFHGLLNSEMKEQAEGCVTIPNITKATMDVILNTLYTGKNGLTSENVIEVWHASNQLQISFMVTLCEKFVIEHMDVYPEIYEHAKLLDSLVVMEKVNDFIMKNFDDFCQTKAFLKLPVHILHSIVDSQDLVISSENVVVESILKWTFHNQQLAFQPKVSSNDGIDDVNNDTDGSISKNTDTESLNETRRGHLAKLLSASRLYLCTIKFLKSLCKNKHVCSCLRSFSMIFDAVMPNLDVGRHLNCWPQQAVPRHCSSSQAGVMYTFINERNESERTLKYVQFNFYKYADRESFHIVDINLVNENKFSITAFNNELYCYNSDLYVLGRNKEWSKVNEMQGRFDKTILVSHGYYIYASHVESNDQNQCSISVYRLEISSRQDNNWSFCVTVSQKKDKHSLVCCGRYILLFTQNQQATNTSVTCYNPEKQKIRDLTNMEGTPENVISFCVEKQVYFLQENCTLWKVVNCHDDTDKLDLEFVSKPSVFSWSVRCAVFYRSHVYLTVVKLDADGEDTLPVSLTDVFEGIVKIDGDSQVTHLYPLRVPKTWLQEEHRIID